MGLGSQTLIMILFALSLDLILGYAGIVTLGHAAFFGLGAYGASLLITDLGWSEPISGLACGALVAAIAGFFSGWLLLRYRGLAFLVLTLSITIMLQQLGNLFRDFTGGYDGIPGVNIAPLFGRFDYDIYGHTYYLYCLGVLLVVFYGVRRIVHSPFGQALVGIRENVGRMNALGSPVHWRLVAAYTISAGVAGIAGALFAQTNTFITLGVFDFDQSAAVLMMLILGGAGWLYGGFIGASLYVVLQNELAKASPEFWQFGIGLLLVAVVLFVRRGTLAKLLDLGRLRRWRTQP
jgi:branched-chain amino acid transport system permease protein